MRLAVEIATGPVEIATTTLDPDDARVEELRRYLSDEEAERQARFCLSRDRRRFAVARGWLREILGRRLDVAPRVLRFRYGPHGKPYLEGGEVSFNLSHSGDRALVAVSVEAEVGVDLEGPHAMDDLVAVARRVFVGPELDAVLAATGADQLRAFLASWTRKEALIKATGLGMTQPLDCFAILRRPDGALVVQGNPTVGRADDWSILDLAVPPQWHAAIAIRSPAAMRRG